MDKDGGDAGMVGVVMGMEMVGEGEVTRKNKERIELDLQTKALILGDLDSGRFTQRQIATKYNVNEATVSRVKRVQILEAINAGKSKATDLFATLRSQGLLQECPSFSPSDSWLSSWKSNYVYGKHKTLYTTSRSNTVSSEEALHAIEVHL